MWKRKILKVIIKKLVNVQTEVEALKNYQEYIDKMINDDIAFEYRLTEEEWKQIKKLTILWGIDLDD